MPYPKDLTLRLLDDQAMRDLLLTVVTCDTPEKCDTLIALYGSDPNRTLIGYEEDGDPVACIGIETTAPGTAVIQQLVVARHARGKGLGSSLIRDTCQILALRRVTAETDRDAVEFYRRCGFKICSLGEKYPGVERFLCELRLVGDPARPAKLWHSCNPS